MCLQHTFSWQNIRQFTRRRNKRRKQMMIEINRERERECALDLFDSNEAHMQLWLTSAVLGEWMNEWIRQLLLVHASHNVHIWLGKLNKKEGDVTSEKVKKTKSAHICWRRTACKISAVWLLGKGHAAEAKLLHNATAISHEWFQTRVWISLPETRIEMAHLQNCIA
jgi:hypothetical protein